MDNIQDNNEFGSYDLDNQLTQYDGYSISEGHRILERDNTLSAEESNDRACCCEPGMPPNVPTYSYCFTNIGNTKCQEKMATREEMLREIRCLNFAIIDISEYLNTHPNDARALCLHREYAQKFYELKEKYQRVYGPLSIYLPCNKWRWLEEPWPWERGE